MPLFNLDPQRNQRKIQRFEKICDNPTLVQCYQNQLETGCKYQSGIQSKLDAIDKIICTHEDPPWWVSLLD